MMRFYFYAIFWILVNLHFISSTQHCPALSMHFSDFGVEGCSPSFVLRSPKDVADAIKSAKCKGWGKWNILPYLGCSSPILPPALQIEYPCLCDFEAECNVHCSDGYQLIGSKTIKCQKDGTYSSLPKCEMKMCEVPDVPAVLKIVGECVYGEGQECRVECISDEYRLKGSSTITCMRGKWSTFPECDRFCNLSKIPSYLVVHHECSGAHGEICGVECANKNHTLIGDPTIKCLESGEWDHAPTCGCSEDTLPSEIILKAGCSISPGKTCDAMCPPSYHQSGDIKTVLCDLDGSWDFTRSIKCLKLCPEPSLPNSVEIIGFCDARRGEVCKVKCKRSSMRLAGTSNTFQCLKSGQYSPIPGCSQNATCPADNLPENLQFIGECTYAYGETCAVGCVDSVFSLVGMSSITCLSTGMWSNMPACVRSCPHFVIPEHMIRVPGTECVTTVGGTCSVRCVDGYSPGKINVVTCLPDGTWEKVPICQKLCPAGEVLGHMVSIGQCSRTVGTICKLECTEHDHVIVPNNTVECLPSGRWSELPICKKVCDIASIPVNMKLVNCPQILEDDQCELGCVKPQEKIFGVKFAACEESGLVIDKSTNCGMGCQKFVAPQGIRTIDKQIDCDFMDPGQVCNVRCGNRKATLIGSQEVTCLGNNKFSPFPKCEVLCPLPQLPPNAHIKESCERHANAKCQVECDNPTDSIEGNKEFQITCRNGKWNTVPPCTKLCEIPKLSDTVRPRFTCKMSERVPCIIMCKDRKSLLIGGNTISCVNQTWTNINVHCVQRCDKPHLPKNLLLSEDPKCLRKVDSQCKVHCKPPFKLQGVEFISCDSLLNWSVFPKCVK